MHLFWLVQAGEVPTGVIGALAAGVGALIGVSIGAGITRGITTIGATLAMVITYIDTIITDTTRDITTDSDTTVTDRTIDRAEIMLRFTMVAIAVVCWEILQYRREAITLRDDMCRVEARQMCV